MFSKRFSEMIGLLTETQQHLHDIRSESVILKYYSISCKLLPELLFGAGPHSYHFAYLPRDLHRPKIRSGH